MGATSCYTETDELIELAKVVKEYDGMLSAHIRCEGLNYVILGGEVVVEDAIYNGRKMGSFILRDS